MIQELRYPRLCLVGWVFPDRVLTRSMLALQISELASIKKYGNSLLLSKTTKNTGKTEKTLAPREINLQSKVNYLSRSESFNVSALHG